jgi:hypothetical protein
MTITNNKIETTKMFIKNFILPEYERILKKHGFDICESVITKYHGDIWYYNDENCYGIIKNFKGLAKNSHKNFLKLRKETSSEINEMMNKIEAFNNWDFHETLVDGMYVFIMNNKKVFVKK